MRIEMKMGNLTRTIIESTEELRKHKHKHKGKKGGTEGDLENRSNDEVAILWRFI